MSKHDHALDNLNTAGRLAGDLPGLLLEAERIAHTFMKGTHGRRRVGQGETFWQFRDYQQGDAIRDIDWRQTAKRDEAFIRQREWEAAQTAWLYRDASASMQFRSSVKLPYKKDYAEIILLALAMILLEGGEQVSLLGTEMAPQSGFASITRLHGYLPRQKDLGFSGRPVGTNASAILISDFYQPVEKLSAFCQQLAEKHVQGLLVQICDPAEVTLDYKGRIKFFDIEDDNAPAFTVPQIEAVRDEYQRRFSAHCESVEAAARRVGWKFLQVCTDREPQSVLSDIYQLLGGR